MRVETVLEPQIVFMIHRKLGEQYLFEIEIF